MGVNIKENQRLLDYQLSDFLELKLSKRERKLALRIRREIRKASIFEGKSLYEFPAIGTSNACVILPNGFSKELKTLYLVNSNGSLRKVGTGSKRAAAMSEPH